MRSVISLIVPIYNMERYLSRCMDSLLGQTCREFEIILVDDGSTDSSGELCDGYAARYPGLVRVIHKPNGGPSSARNAGMDAARGEFVIFPDPDDWAEPDYVESLFSLQRQHDADMVCVGHYIDTGETSKPAGGNGMPILMEGTQAQRGLLLPPGLHGFSWGKLYRLDLIRKHSLRFREELFIAEDLWFAYCYLPHCRVVCHAPAKRVYHYCQSQDSITANVFSPHKLGAIEVLAWMASDTRERDPELCRAAEDAICIAAVNLVWMLENSGLHLPDTMKELRTQIRRTLPIHLRSAQYGAGRKLQAVLALFCPRGYAMLKNLVQRRKWSD